MVRKFDLYGNDIEWEISLRGYDIWNGTHDERANKKHKFAVFCKEDGLIMGMFDLYIGDGVIEAAQKDKSMQEVCEFHHKEKRFQVTFVDAPLYVKENFKVRE